MANQPQWRQSAQDYLRQVQGIYQSQEVIVKASFRLILSVFTVAFFTLFALRPTLGSISVLLKRIEDQKEVSRRLDNKIAQLSEAEEILSLKGRELTGLTNRAVPEGPNVDKMAQQIEAIANESGVILTSANIQGVPMFGEQEKGSEPGGTKFFYNPEQEFVTFSFTVGGGQEEIIRFLSQLENMERAVLLAKIGFNKPQKQLAGQLPLLASGKATIYYLPENNE